MYKVTDNKVKLNEDNNNEQSRTKQSYVYKVTDNKVKLNEDNNNEQLSGVYMNRMHLVNKQECKNDTNAYDNGCENMYYGNMNNAKYLQHDILSGAVQGGGSSDGRAPEFKKFRVFNAWGELKLSFAAISMDGPWEEQTKVRGNQMVNFDSIPYTVLRIVSNHGERHRQLLHIDGEEGSDLQGFFWWFQEKGDIRLQILHRDIEQYMEVVGRGHFLIRTNSKFQFITKDLKQEAKQAYWEYMREKIAWERHGCSYVKYMQYVIDGLIHQMENINVESDDESIKVESQPLTDGIVEDKMGTCIRERVRVNPRNNHDLSDYNILTKKVGHLALDSTDFRFIGPDRLPIAIDSIDKCLRIGTIIRNTNLPNYRMARIPLISGLNIPAWERQLQGYPDDRLIQYIKFGFPLSLISPDRLHNQEVSNHFSARQYPQDIQKYLNKEISLGAMLGPVDSVDSKDFHCSPLMSRPKDGDSRRVIMDLSFPQGNALNDQVTKEKFDGTPLVLKLPSIDDFVKDIVSIKEDPVMFKIDVARAFRNLPVDPVDALKLGIKWEGSFYLDKSVAFGWIFGTASFQLLSDSIAYFMRDYCNLHCYIDDYVAVLPKIKADVAFDKLCSLLQELGLPLNIAKLTPPTKRLTYLGIDIDLDSNTMAINEEKLQDIYAECVKIRGQKYLSKNKFQALMGKLLYIQKIVKPARVFINRILATFREGSHKQKIYLNKAFHADIDWFIKFLPSFNGITFIEKNAVDDTQSLFLDASLTGLGAVWRDRVYATPVREIPGFVLTIVHLEMFNVLLALRVWGQHWRHSSVKIFCDNHSVVQVVKNGKTRDPFLALCIRNIWLHTALYDVHLIIEHIAGKENRIADTLSRIHSNKLVDENILKHLVKNYHWEPIFHSYFDLTLHI